MDPEEIVKLASVWLTIGLGGLFLLMPKFTAGLVGFGDVNSPFTGFRTFGGLMAALGAWALHMDNNATYTVLAVAWGGAGAANLFALILEDDDATRMALLRLLVSLGIGGALYYFVS